MPSSTKFSAKFTEVDLSPFLKAPFVGDEGFPNEAQKRCGELVGHAYSTSGFIILSNFGPTMDDLNKPFNAAKELFANSQEYKEKELKQFNYAEDGMIIGYRNFGEEHLNPSRQPDIKESFQVNEYDMQKEENFRGTKPEFREAMRDFASVMGEGARNLAVAMAMGLNLEPDFFRKNMTDLSRNVLRAVHYPATEFRPQAMEDESQAIRVSEHCDISMMTFVFTDSPGLQMRVEREGEVGWAPIPLPQGATAVVNTGAMSCRWTNDKYVITQHRCVIESEEQASKDRYSVIYFNNPNHDTVLEVHPSLIPEGGKSNYDVMTAGEHLAYMRNKIVGKANLVKKD